MPAIDRLQDVEKSVISGRLLAAHVEGKISWDQFVELNYCVEMAHLSALHFLRDLIVNYPGESFVKGWGHENGIAHDGVWNPTAILLESSGLAYRLPNTQSKSFMTTKIFVTSYGMMIFEYGLHPDSNWRNK